FQAEDGIRDGHVTGVQTCALPISRRHPAISFDAQRGSRQLTLTPGTYPVELEAAVATRDGSLAHVRPVRPEDAERLLTFLRALRSEERRVGKECGSGWSVDRL